MDKTTSKREIGTNNEKQDIRLKSVTHDTEYTRTMMH